MPEAKYNYDELKRRREAGETWRKIAVSYGLPDTRASGQQLANCYRQHQHSRTVQPKGTPPRGSMPKVGSPQVQIEGDKGITTIYVRQEPKSVEAITYEFGMDLDVWEPVKVKTGSWNGWAIIDNTPTIADLYTIRVEWARRQGVATAKEVIEAVLAKHGVGKRAPNFKRPTGPGVLGLNIPDLHLGKLCWPRETGEDYNLSIACQTFAECIRDLAERHRATKQPTGHIIVPVGNDFLNSDGPIGGKGAFTAAGTPQDEDGRHQKSFEMGLFMILDEIENLKKLFPKARIVIKVVPGNHDETRIFYLGVALRVHFRNDKRVYVDNNPTTRKFFDGLAHASCPVALMFTHGHREKPVTYPALMAHHFDLRQYRAKEVWTGHLHHRKGVSFDTYAEVEQLLCRQFPSLSPADAWHAGQGYILSQRCAQSIYFRPDGYVGNIDHHYPKDLTCDNHQQGL